MSQAPKPAAILPADVTFRPASPSDAEAIETLNAEAFGPGRFARAAFRLREGNPAVDQLCHVAIRDGELVGSVTFSHILIGKTPALLLGPLTVATPLKNLGIGVELMRLGLAAAQEMGHSLVILVGDAPYYARVGFVQIPPGQVKMPGPVDPARLLVCALKEGAEAEISGAVLANPSGPDGR